MDLAEIKQLMREFSDSPIFRLSLEYDSVKIMLEKQAAEAWQASPAACQPVTVVSQPAVTINAEEDCGKPKDDEIPVCSPVVGVYYATPSPDAEPFVQVGQQVKKGQTVCIVEAMKMMNEIPAPVSGKVTRILVKPEDTVEYNQPLMFISQAQE